MNIKKADVDKMIKEEFQKMMEKKKLTSRLSQINEELKNMESEDSLLNEVEAGGQTKVASHAWTGEENGDVKWKPEFEKQGSSLKEDGMPGEEMEAEIENEPAMGEFEAKFAEIGRAIDAKMNADSMETPSEDSTEIAGETGDSDEDFEEVEVEPETGSDDEIEEVMDAKVGEDQHLSPESAEKIDEPTNNLEGEVQQESVEEPLEGHSVAQEVSADTVNDNMEKDTHVKESAGKKGAVITEAKTPESKNIFTEGVDENKKTALLEEFNRMKKFAGLSKEEE